MKKNFKKLMSVLLAVLMLCSVFSVATLAAGPYTITLQGGQRGNGANRVYGALNQKLMAIDGNTYTDENGIVYTIDKEENTITFQTDANGKFVFPEYFFDMPGYTQTSWVTNKSNNTGKKLAGVSGSVTKKTTYYAGYDTAKYDVNFFPGADGIGDAVSITEKSYKAKITLEGAIFTRPGYVHIGWATVENAEVAEYGFLEEYVVLGNVNFYPVWQKSLVGIEYDVNIMSFGSICEGYIAPEAQILTITNIGNGEVSFVAPTSEAFNIVADTTTIAPNGGKAFVSIQPKASLNDGKYFEKIDFDFGNEELNFSISVKFAVNKHLYVKFIYNNDATYIADGTETAECFSGCGATFDRTAEGTMKIYSADSNTADGLMKEYLYHKTVKFVAFGSGMDANPAKGDTLSKRFRPTEWSVADTAFGGTFDANTTDYTVMYDHGDGNFGTYTLTIKYVEEEKNADDEWVATGIEDVKNFKYSIGPSEKDNQEVVRPNMIVSIIFGLFGYLIDLITSGSLF